MSEAIWRRGDLLARRGRSLVEAGEIDVSDVTELVEETDGDQGLRAVQRTVVDLVQAMPQPPSRLVVRAGGVEIDVDWRSGAGATAVSGPGPALAAAATPPAAVPGGSDGPAPASTPGVDYVCSPSVGTFYGAPEPGASPFVTEGALIRIGQTVAIVEAMKLMLPVESDRSGRIVEILVADGQGVEFGERLFAVQTDA